MENQTADYIKTAADCSVKQFMAACFDNKLKVLVISGEPTEQELKEAFEYIYAQYIDYAGLYLTREFELSAYINSLDTRVNTVKHFIQLQRRFLAEFGMPFLPGFYLVKRYGHSLYWVNDFPDKENFLKKLLQIELKEKKYQVELDKKIRDLIDLTAKKLKKEFTLLENRKEFIQMLNRLQQARFVIDKNDTSVEELAIMIKDQRDQVEAEKAAQRFKK